MLTNLYLCPPKGLPPCTPSGLACFESGSSALYNCSSQCLGTFADVSSVTQDIHIRDSSKLEVMAQGYQERKQEYARNVYFNKQGKASSYFGNSNDIVIVQSTYIIIF